MSRHPDALTPTGALTAEELERARQIVAANPDAVWPAVQAALSLGACEDTLDRMQALLREVSSCSAS